MQLHQHPSSHHCSNTQWIHTLFTQTVGKIFFPLCFLSQLNPTLSAEYHKYDELVFEKNQKEHLCGRVEHYC